MADNLFSAVKGHFKLDEVDTDNWMFKLYYKASFGICLTGSILCAATAYIGNPITCDHKNVPSLDQVHQYCWIHGTSAIDPKYQKYFKCISDQDGAKSGEIITAYYQWVVFFLILNAILFLVPSRIWKAVEGGTMAHFGTKAKTTSEMAEDAQRLVSANVRYFRIVKEQSNRYFAVFVFCELLNIVVLIANFYLTDVFLSHKFATYGAETVRYFMLNDVSKRDEGTPLCKVFPTQVGCNFGNVGLGGNGQTINGLCILSQNTVNQKIFLVLWFWYVFLMIVSGASLVYRLATILAPALRIRLLCFKIGGSSEDIGHQKVAGILKNSRLGDWFILNQLAKNTSPYFFREFLMALDNDNERENVNFSTNINNSNNMNNSLGDDVELLSLCDQSSSV